MTMSISKWMVVRSFEGDIEVLGIYDTPREAEIELRSMSKEFIEEVYENDEDMYDVEVWEEKRHMIIRHSDGEFPKYILKIVEI